jgi:hypothetical protein
MIYFLTLETLFDFRQEVTYQTSKTDNNVLDIDAIHNLKLGNKVKVNFTFTIFSNKSKLC